jgi:UDP-N-acetylglucosamine diphosphorylase / glucose-1-phosphate thymidylyltransferase / UDP-N-acetylgalactosamine diphosphorylase / glucosamine-1-phosphate N-acetyltransferase / galactosamine-1-phosphate N-acetyltransferase
VKAVILAAGRGSRLKEKTEPLNKCMLVFHGKPLIEFSLESAYISGVAEIIVVVGYRAQDVINTYGIQYKGIKIQYVFQEKQQGLVNAIEQTQEALQGDDFILLLADEILLNPKPKEMIEKFREEKLFAICGVTKAEDITQISKTYSVIYDERTEKIYRLIEKPRKPLNHIMGTGNCIFRNTIFEYIKYTPINYFRQEKELPDLIQCSIDDGNDVKLFFIGAQYININTQEDIELAEKMYASA